MSGVEHPIEEYTEAVYHALHCGLGKVIYTWRDKTHVRPPMMSDVMICSWPQTWGSTCLAFDANPNTIAGAACTDALTVTVQLDGRVLVYVGGRWAYSVSLTISTEEQFAAFEQDVKDCAIHGQRHAITRYGAILPEDE